jgi:hypothetical protein
MFASKGLQELVGKYQLRSAMEAEHHKKEASDLYQHLNGKKVKDEHELAVAQLDRAITAKRYATGDPSAAVGGVSDTAGHKTAWAASPAK